MLERCYEIGYSDSLSLFFSHLVIRPPAETFGGLDALDFSLNSSVQAAEYLFDYKHQFGRLPSRSVDTKDQT